MELTAYDGIMIDPGYALAGAVTGFVVGLTGVGGGALMTPLLLLVFGIAPHVAIATDLWFAAITKLIGASVHHRNGLIDWRIAKRLWAGSLPAAALVVSIVALADPIGRTQWLTKIIAAVVILTAFGIVFAPRLIASLVPPSRDDQPAEPDRAAPTVLAGAVLGGLVALTSIGAGALGTVLLLYLYPRRLLPHRLVATDLAHAIPLAMVAGAGYLVAGMVDWHILISLLTGSIPAVIVGGLSAGRLSGRRLQIALAAVLFAVGLKGLLF
ncbi:MULTISPECIES: sulfite exporter TauE/SafE family protein [Rhodopseudomonas]|uniref:sulfite exporter TauE/SafE family protein n=1 Tax=Rhodopseudomonas TaxID=1073 RepID=UPI0009B96C50|nr:MULTISPECIES: sulfite exporter TauE/SafE family protein [Rhodopseudomonas]NEW88550.1 sulfite exporter TauE/SafE family protein [Rhodopseudomonas sp. WA056]QDL96975.1 sulfite exporter TauE/SafE family protein [Rhodopseudomonas palustris]